MRWMLQSRILKCSLHALVFKDVGGGYVNLVCITYFAYVCSGWHSAIRWLWEFPTVQRQAYQVDWNLWLSETTCPCYIPKRGSSIRNIGASRKIHLYFLQHYQIPHCYRKFAVPPSFYTFSTEVRFFAHLLPDCFLQGGVCTNFQVCFSVGGWRMVQGRPVMVVWIWTEGQMKTLKDKSAQLRRGYGPYWVPFLLC